MSQISEGIDKDTVLPALCASSSSESESQQQSAIQVDMEAQLQKTIANAASSESNRGLQHTSMEIKICSHPYQPHSQVFPKKRFGQAKPEYHSFKVMIDLIIVTGETGSIRRLLGRELTV